jgi:hypothetical protein
MQKNAYCCRHGHVQLGPKPLDALPPGSRRPLWRWAPFGSEGVLDECEGREGLEEADEHEGHFVEGELFFVYCGRG